MPNRLTIKDIARLSGVSKSTVSRVLNNESNVNPQTRQRVDQVIQEYGFTPSKSARAMRGHTDKVVGILVSRIDSNAENQAIRGILPVLYHQGYDPIIMESQFSQKRVKEHLHTLSQRKVDGLIIFAFTQLNINSLAPWREKLIVMARDYPDFSCVNYDDRGAIELLMQPLFNAGHRHIGYIGVEHTDSSTGLQRSLAYHDFCQRHQLIPHEASGELSYQSGYQLAPQILTSSPTAIVCASDTIALGVMKYLQQHGLEQHIHVGGIGNNALLRFLFPTTSTVDLGYVSAGQQAASQLLLQLTHGFEVTKITVECQPVLSP